ncbi:MAG: 3-hydroxyacyl-CoA dehydrogenase NAD-binding domain-containing protein [Pseudomonadota bacterium]
MTNSIECITIVGAGPIGRSWAALFLEKGLKVHLIDLNEIILDEAHAWLQETTEARDKLTLARGYSDWPSDCEWVQECGPDDRAIKRAILSAVSEKASPDAIIASSCSTFDPIDLALDVKHPEQLLLVHPFNPPHVIPGVEVVPSQKTSHEVTNRATSFLRSIGRSPIVLKTYVEGLIINRLQGALMREAFSLYCDNIADIASIDACIADGLALRWVSVGTFGTNHTNADGGIGEYFTKYADWTEIMEGLASSAPVFTPEFVAKLKHETQNHFGDASVSDLSKWRDRTVQAVLEQKKKDPRPGHG